MPAHFYYPSKFFYEEKCQNNLMVTPAPARGADVFQYMYLDDWRYIFGYYRQVGNEKRLIASYGMRLDDCDWFVQETHNDKGELHTKLTSLSPVLTGTCDLFFKERIDDETVRIIEIYDAKSGKTQDVVSWHLGLCTITEQYNRDFKTEGELHPGYDQFISKCMPDGQADTFKLYSYRSTGNLTGFGSVLDVNAKGIICQRGTLNKALDLNGPVVQQYYYRSHAPIPPHFVENQDYEQLAVVVRSQPLSLFYNILKISGTCKDGKLYGPAQLRDPFRTLSVNYESGAILPGAQPVEYRDGRIGFNYLYREEHFTFTRTPEGCFVFDFQGRKQLATEFLERLFRVARHYFSHITNYLSYQELQNLSVSVWTHQFPLPEMMFGENFGQPIKTYSPMLPGLQWMSHAALSDMALKLAEQMTAKEIKNDLSRVLLFLGKVFQSLTHKKALNLDELNQSKPACCVDFPLLMSAKRKGPLTTPEELKQILNTLTVQYWPWVLERLMAIKDTYQAIFNADVAAKEHEAAILTFTTLSEFFTAIEQSIEQRNQTWLDERPSQAQVEVDYKEREAQHVATMHQFFVDSQEALKQQQLRIEASWLGRGRDLVNAERKDRKELVERSSTTMIDLHTLFQSEAAAIKKSMVIALEAIKKAREVIVSEEIDQRRSVLKANSTFVTETEAYKNSLLSAVYTERLVRDNLKKVQRDESDKRSGLSALFDADHKEMVSQAKQRQKQIEQSAAESMKKTIKDFTVPLEHAARTARDACAEQEIIERAQCAATIQAERENLDRRIAQWHAARQVARQEVTSEELKTRFTHSFAREQEYAGIRQQHFNEREIVHQADLRYQSFFQSQKAVRIFNMHALVPMLPDGLKATLNSWIAHNPLFSSLVLEIYRTKLLIELEKTAFCQVSWRKIFLLTHEPYAHASCYETRLEQEWGKWFEASFQSYSVFCTNYITPAVTEHLPAIQAALTPFQHTDDRGHRMAIR
ncbi:MAG: hypothetical protein NTW08_08195 [Gammaproteobacteria bacterium]|nr:hypothetical protein [Gammaproteobacteria bacterium]